MLLEKKINKINFVMDNTLMNDIKIWSFTTFLCLGICMSSLFGMESLEVDNLPNHPTVEGSSFAKLSASFTESTDEDLLYDYDKIWDSYEISVISSDLEAHHLEELFNNKYAALRVRKFLTEDECESLANAALNSGFDYYENVKPPIARIGITQFEAHSRDKSYYFDRVNEAKLKLDSIYSMAGINVIDRVMDKIRDVSKKEVSIAREKSNGEIYFAGLIRYIQRAFIHFDFAKFDAPGWEISDVESQLSWNIYLKTPQQGGENIVYEFALV
jgi:hypothetical protein